MSLTYEEKKALMEKLDSAEKGIKEIKEELDKEFEDTETAPADESEEKPKEEEKTE